MRRLVSSWHRWRPSLPTTRPLSSTSTFASSFSTFSLPTLTPALLHALPKADLHLHLDGSLRLDTLIDLAQQRCASTNSPPPPTFPNAGAVPPSDWTADLLHEEVFHPQFDSLEEYLRMFAFTLYALQQGPDAVERVAYELALDAAADNCSYIEVRFAPQLLASDAFSVGDVVKAVDRGLASARSHLAHPGASVATAPSFEYGIIVCAMRSFDASSSPYYAKCIETTMGMLDRERSGLFALVLAQNAVAIRDAGMDTLVGLDIAGPENGFPPQRFVEAFHYAHQNLMHATVHAGESYSAESIYQAITLLFASRIGHGVRLYDAEAVAPSATIPHPADYCRRLADFLVQTNVAIEVCVTSNLQTLPACTLENHALHRFLHEGMEITMCTDNTLMSQTTMTRELQLLVDHFGATHEQLRETVLTGFRRSFFAKGHQRKAQWLQQAAAHYDAVMASHAGM